MNYVRFRSALIALFVSGAITVAVEASDQPAQLLEDFIHYTLTANPDLAAGSAQTLFDSGISDAELAVILDEGKRSVSDFDRAVLWAQRIAELEPIASELAKRIEDGRLDLARDQERIEEAIEMLLGTQRQKLIARNRLIEAGEYAVPPLLRRITEGQDERLRFACQDVLVNIGRQAVTPLCESIPYVSGPSQRVICDILGTIRHPHAAPYLREVSLEQGIDEAIRDAAERALTSIGASGQNLSNMYTELSRQYFDGHVSLIAFPHEDANNVWNYDQFTGLIGTPVPTVIYSEVMSMRTSSKALRLDSSNEDALSLFVAANLRRENDLPAEGADPIYGDTQYSPEFYATVFGTQTCLDVLALALDRFDTPLIRDAIAALSRTTGGANLFTRGTGRQPLLEALTYPDRRVQYEAALTLGLALPQEPFAGDYSVVPILASAVRTGSEALAVVVADDPENRSIAASELEKLGFLIVASGGSVSEVQQDIARSIGVDFVAIRMRSSRLAIETVNALRAIPRTGAAPILIVSSATDMPALRTEYRDDQRVNLTLAGVNPETFSAAVDSVIESGAGGRMSEVEAEEYAIRALGALRDIAISRCPAYSIADAESALIDALDTRSGGLRLLVADILSLIDSDLAQRKLFDAAFAASGGEQIDFLARVTDSVRLFGDRAEQRHVDALLDLIMNSSGAVADAAANVHGALNLPSSDAVQMIP